MFSLFGNNFRGGFGGQISGNTEIFIHVYSFNKHFKSTNYKPCIVLVLGIN